MGSVQGAVQAETAQHETGPQPRTGGAPPHGWSWRAVGVGGSALLVAALGRVPRFLAKATLWSVLPARLLLNFAGVVPVQRRVDVPPDATRSDLGERRLVAGVLAPRPRHQPGCGDACAPVPPPAAADFELVATTDPCPAPLVSSLGWDDLYHRGWLLATIKLSDLAAAGAVPLGLMVSYVLPGDLPVAQFERLVRGVDDC